MSETNGWNIYDYGCSLIEGKEAIINMSISPSSVSDELASILNSRVGIDEELKKAKEEERKQFNEIKAGMNKWIKKAKQTRLLQITKEIQSISNTKHTNNRWELNNYGGIEEISNTVYKMWIRRYTYTQYNRETKQQEPIAWEVSWCIGTNAPRNNESNNRNYKIAEQMKKKFKTEEEAERYIAGRKKAYSQYFVDQSPVVPKEYIDAFSFCGVLLPGYKAET